MLKRPFARTRGMSFRRILNMERSFMLMITTMDSTVTSSRMRIIGPSVMPIREITVTKEGYIPQKMAAMRTRNKGFLFMGDLGEMGTGGRSAWRVMEQYQ